jgi:hypothetical protein
MTTCEQCRELIWDELFGLLEPARRGVPTPLEVSLWSSVCY